MVAGAAIAALGLIFGFGVTPAKLSPTEPKPVRLTAHGGYRTDDGSHVPAVRELQVDVDRHLSLELEDVPVCSGSHYDYRGSIEDFCRDALIGRGKVTVEIAFPEEPMMWVQGTLNLYNGGRKPDGRYLIAYAFLSAPITGALLLPITIRRIDSGRFGWRVTAEVPKIAGGSGSIFGYSVRIGKRFLSATCAGQFEIRTVSTFIDGTSLSERVVRPCAVPEPHVRK